MLAICPILCHAQAYHFWDGIEEFDGPTDRNPLMEMQIDYYFDSLVSPLPDSICTEIDRLLGRNINTELRDFILWHLLTRYQNPVYMVQDQVFIHLYDNYFSKLEIKDLKDGNLLLIADKAERLRRLQFFCIAPNFKGTDFNGRSFNLHEIESDYVVLFFFDHDCFTCNDELDELTHINLPEISIVAIDTNPDGHVVDNNLFNISTININEDLFKLYDVESTPMIYVLDRDKRIIAKRIRAEQIKLFIQ